MASRRKRAAPRKAQQRAKRGGAIEVAYGEALAEEVRPYVSQDSMFKGVFELGPYLGAGAHSVVYEGWALRPRKRRVCIKVELQCGPGQLALLGTENLVLQRLPDRLDRVLHARGYLPNTKYPPEPSYCLNVLVTDLWGATLDRFVADERGGEVDIPHFGREAVLCVQQAHEAGFVHRDIRPDNFCVDLKPSARPKLCLIDFGIAKPHDHLHDDHRRSVPEPVVVGTEPYVSAAGARREAQSWRDDLEAVCFMLWRLAEGSLPWESLGAAQWVKSKEQAPLSRDAPQWVRAFVAQCRRLEFGEVPDYSALIAILEGAGGSMALEEEEEEEGGSESSEFEPSPQTQKRLRRRAQKKKKPPARRSRRTRAAMEQQQEEEEEEEEEESPPKRSRRSKPTPPSPSSSEEEQEEEEEEEEVKSPPRRPSRRKTRARTPQTRGSGRGRGRGRALAHAMDEDDDDAEEKEEKKKAVEKKNKKRAAVRVSTPVAEAPRRTRRAAPTATATAGTHRRHPPPQEPPEPVFGSPAPLLSTKSKKRRRRRDDDDDEEEEEEGPSAAAKKRRLAAVGVAATSALAFAALLVQRLDWWFT